jgi:hypothetical protein
VGNVLFIYLHFISSPSYEFHGVALRPFHIAWVPVHDAPAQVTREHLSLMSVKPDHIIRGIGGAVTYLKDFFEKVTYRDDLKCLEISGLPAGEYVLLKLHPYVASVVIRIGVPLESGSTNAQEKYTFLIFKILV